MTKKIKLETLIIATNNPGKIKELKQLLDTMNYNILALSDLKTPIEVIEDGITFKQNAVKKAVEVFNAVKEPSLADDSGLCVDALDGRPGVFSARYGTPGMNDEQRCRLLLDELKDVSPEKRTASFQCVIAYKASDKTLKTFKGSVHGKIATTLTGTKGFGYDPLFIPDGYTLTMAQIKSSEKNRISHRAKALNKFLDYLSGLK